MQQEAIVYCFSTLFSGQNFSSIFPLIFLQKFQSSFVENFRQNISIAVVWPKNRIIARVLLMFGYSGSLAMIFVRASVSIRQIKTRNVSLVLEVKFYIAATTPVINGNTIND